jgi:hypothetical protein
MFPLKYLDAIQPVKCALSHSKVKENLDKAINIFKECGADGWVEKYEKDLAET